jgi:Pyridoxamine 5'-phosphate oxidase
MAAQPGGTLASATDGPWTESVRSFIDDPTKFAVLACLDGQGRPTQAVLWYEVRDGAILINSLVGRQWPAHLQRDPRCSLTIADGYDYVIVSGIVEVVAKGDQALEDIQDLARRYGQDPADFAGQERISFLLRPDRIGTHGRIA